MTSATQTKENLFKTLINNMDNSSFSKHNDFLNYHKQQKVLNDQIIFRKKMDKNFCQLMLNDIDKDLEELNFQKKFAEKRNDTILSDIQKQNFKSFDISNKTNDSKNKLNEGKKKFQEYLNQQYAIIKNDFILQFYNKQNDLIVQHAIMKNKLRENEKQLKLEDEYLNNINALNEELLKKIRELKNQNDMINQERDKKNIEILLLQKRYNEDMIKALNEPIKPLEKEPVLRATRKIPFQDSNMLKTTKNFTKFKEYYLVLNMNHKHGILDDIRQKKIDIINKKLKEETDKEIKNFSKTARYSHSNIKAMINNFLSNSLKIDDFNKSSKDDYNINSDIGDENISNKKNSKFKNNSYKTEKKRSKSISTISNRSSLNQKKNNDEKSDIKIIEKKSDIIISNEVSNNASNININQMNDNKSYTSNKASAGLLSSNKINAFNNFKLNDNNKNNENKEIKLNDKIVLNSNKKITKIVKENDVKQNNKLKESQKSKKFINDDNKKEKEEEEQNKKNIKEQNKVNNEEDKKENEKEDIKENFEEDKKENNKKEDQKEEDKLSPLQQIILEKPPLNDERVLPEYKLKILEKIINNIEIYAKKQKPGKLIYAKKHSNTKNNKQLIKNKFYELLNSLEYDTKENSDKLFNKLDIDMAMQFLFELLNTNHNNNLDFNNLETNKNYNETDFENDLDNYYLDIYLKILEHFKKMIKEKRISLQIAVNYLSKALLNLDEYDILLQEKLNLVLEKKLSKKSTTTNNNLFNTNTFSGGFNLQSTGSMGFQQFNTQNNFSNK